MKIYKHDKYFDSFFNELSRMIILYTSDDIVSSNEFYISGDIEDIIKAVRAHDIINIKIDDKISTLSTTNANNITSDKSIGSQKIISIRALNHTHNKLPIKLQDIEKLIVEVWINKYRPIVMSEIKSMFRLIAYTFPKLKLTWTVGVHPNINDNMAIILTAVNKQKMY